VSKSSLRTLNTDKGWRAESSWD